MRRLLAWFRAHRIVTWSLRVIVALWGIQLWMNWAAEREWRQYCEEARRRGVKLTLAEFAPPEIPDAENFAMLPMFKAAATGAMPPLFDLPKSSQGLLLPGGDPIKGKPIDWKEWQQAFKTKELIGETSDDPVADVLKGFYHFAPQIDEWRQWKQRPQCWFPLDVPDNPSGSLKPFGVMQSAAHFFAGRMQAHLAQRDSQAALDDFRDALQSYRALRIHPTLIAGIVRTALLAIIDAKTGSGLAAHAWAEPELRALDAELSGLRIWEDYRLCMASERAFTAEYLDRKMAKSPWQRMRESTESRTALAAFLGGSTSWNWEDVYTGFILSKHKVRDNELRLNRYIDELLAAASEEGPRLKVDQVASQAAATQGRFLEPWHYKIFYSVVPQYDNASERYMRAETQLRQLRLAIALERFHLAHGAFPETLNELTPAFLADLPLDPCDGQPMRYHRAKTDSYLLYSVGKDRQDDGGTIDPTKIESRQHDAVWLYAP